MQNCPAHVVRLAAQPDAIALHLLSTASGSRNTGLTDASSPKKLYRLGTPGAEIKQRPSAYMTPRKADRLDTWVANESLAHLPIAALDQTEHASFCVESLIFTQQGPIRR